MAYNYDRTKIAGGEWKDIQHSVQEDFLMKVLAEARREAPDLYFASKGGGVVFGDYQNEEVLLMFDPKNIHNLRMGYKSHSNVVHARDARTMGKVLAKWLTTQF